MVILPPNHLFATNEIANKKSTRHQRLLNLRFLIFRQAYSSLLQVFWGFTWDWLKTMITWMAEMTRMIRKTRMPRMIRLTRMTDVTWLTEMTKTTLMNRVTV